MAAAVGATGIVALGLSVMAPARLGPLLLAGAVAVIAAVLGLRSPVLACAYLLLTTFFRLAVPSGTLPVDPFLLAFAGVLASVWLRARPWQRRTAGMTVDPVTCVIGLYIVWNLLSIVVPHALPAGSPWVPEPFPVLRFVLIGTVLPFSMFLVGRYLFTTERALRVLLGSMLAAAAYSAAVSILASTAPQLVWPRYIVDTPTWTGRAVGVFNQPVVNGLVLIIGFLVATLILAHDRERPVLRVTAAVVGGASLYAIYLTHTRAVWLAFALVVLIGAVAASGSRAGFALVGAALVGVVATSWDTFTSADRSAGGVGSVGELHDRLNSIATSIWAFQQEPLTGWGIGRFPAVNTYHHRAWSPEIPWERGFGIVSHLDGLGILVELGIVGLALWLTVLVLVYRGVGAAVRRLPAHGVYGRALGLTALLCLIAQSVVGLTVDLRFFDFPNVVVMLFAGAVIGWQREQARRSDTGVVAPPAATAVAVTPGGRVRDEDPARVSAVGLRGGRVGTRDGRSGTWT
ncbi:O-antigen ligase family protein [Geodermatophilus sp. SYSU D00867]